MCGIFGTISDTLVDKVKIYQLVKHSQQRGRDSSGLIYFKDSRYHVNKSDYCVEKLLKKVAPFESNVILGHSRLITNGLEDNQPVVRDNLCVIHNGIIVNDEEVWNTLSAPRHLKIDSEVILGITEEFLKSGGIVEDIASAILSRCKGVLACALVLPTYGKLILFSNNGSLYVGYDSDKTYFASESYGLTLIGCDKVHQVKEKPLILDIPIEKSGLLVREQKSRTENLIPEFKVNKLEEGLLEFSTPKLKRCTRCILPETMPFIRFDENGICNYCKNYKLRNNPKPKEELFKLVDGYRRASTELDCIVPFSGGRDSCYGLHLIVKELKMKPVTYTYDWGMVTDLG